MPESHTEPRTEPLIVMAWGDAYQRGEKGTQKGAQRIAEMGNLFRVRISRATTFGCVIEVLAVAVAVAGW